jgi:phosphatidylinositol alpha-1,6-mannosyltransferase
VELAVHADEPGFSRRCRHRDQACRLAVNRHIAILALVTDAWGGRGGIAQYNRDFLLALAPTAAVRVLPRHAPEYVDDLPAGVTQLRPRAGRWRYIASALHDAIRHRPALVFCGHLYMAPLAALLARLCRARLVVQTHGIEAWARPSHWVRWATESADLVLSVSRYTRAQVLNWAAIEPERVAVLPNTVSERFTPGDRAAARRRFGLGNQRVLLTVSRLAASERYKGHDRVIESLPTLLAGGHDVIYLIAGDGDDRPRLEALARSAGIADRVRFLGAVSRDDLPDLYRAADVFVMPSTGEGFGIAFLEAMACGTLAVGLAIKGDRDALAPVAGLGEILSLESSGSDHEPSGRAGLSASAGNRSISTGSPPRVDAGSGTPAASQGLRNCPMPIETSFGASSEAHLSSMLYSLLERKRVTSTIEVASAVGRRFACEIFESRAVGLMARAWACGQSRLHGGTRFRAEMPKGA